MEIEKIISAIENQDSISIDESFSFAKNTSILLRGDEEKGRSIIIYILDNWEKLPDETIEIWTDLIESAGFYPYLEKEKERLKFNNLGGEIRKTFHLSDNIISKEDEKYFFHEEQKHCKSILDSGKNLIVSAPTSFGKSLLIEDVVASRKFKNIVVIQPTLALLDETRKKLQKYKEHYKIIVRTSQDPSEEKGNLFLLTAERVMEYQNLPLVGFFVIDEFYKLSAERDDERSDTLNNAFYKLLQQDIVPQFYLLGPNIDGISEGFAEKYNAVFYVTNYSLIENKTIDIYSDNKSKFDKPIKYKAFKEKKLFELLLDLKDEQTIVYCSSPSRTRSLAKTFCLFLAERGIKQSEDLPLVEWIKNHINSSWNLIDFLNYKVGINDGALQKHINSSMIDYFNDKKLKYIFCTSTIIEGVNTSAKNIVFFDKKKGPNNIDFFDYSNIKGRSGRMMIHYIGKIFNFNPPPEKQGNMIVDIPFFQQNPIKDEVLNGLKGSDVKNEVRESEQYQELLKIPKEERELFQRNGVSIKGQKHILDQLQIDILDKQKVGLVNWVTSEYKSPKYEQLEYTLSLAWKNLLKEGETTRPMTLGNLIRVTNFYGIYKKIDWLIDDIYQNNKDNKKWINVNKNRIENILKNLTTKKEKDIYKKNEEYKKYNYTRKFFNLSDNELIQISVTNAFHILRHWFQYKVPKWLSVMNELQKYVCEKNKIKPGNYGYYAS